MNIETEDYKVSYERNSSIITCQGFLQLNGMQEYAEIIELLDQVIEELPAQITLNLKELELLNSSGINMFSKFVIKVRKTKEIRMVVQGTQEFEWQEKSLTNLQRLMPGLELEWE